MKENILKTLIIGFVLISSTNAYARKVASGTNCTMNENITININFKGTLEKAEEAIPIIAKKGDEITQMAKDLGLKTIQITSQNFSINSTNNSNYDSTYRYNGSFGLKVAPYDKALKLLDMIKSKNSNASLNTNSYSQGNCK